MCVGGVDVCGCVWVGVGGVDVWVWMCVDVCGCVWKGTDFIPTIQIIISYNVDTNYCIRQGGGTAYRRRMVIRECNAIHDHL